MAETPRIRFVVGISRSRGSGRSHDQYGAEVLELPRRNALTVGCIRRDMKSYIRKCLGDGSSCAGTTAKNVYSRTTAACAMPGGARVHHIDVYNMVEEPTLAWLAPCA